MGDARTAWAMLLSAAVLLGGCAFGKKPATQPTTQPGPPRVMEPVLQTVLSPNARPLVYRLVRPDDPPLEPEAFVMTQLDVYDIAAPAGLVSGDPEFMALLEPLSDAALAQTPESQLQKNGMRMGLGAQLRWEEFKKVLEKQPVRTTPTGVMGTSGRAELTVQEAVPAQTIFYFDASGELVGRSFDSSENYWALRFNPVLHAAGTTHISLTPAVRAQRRRVEFSRSNGEMKVEYVQPESLFDMGLGVQVPRGKFLVLCPAAGSARQSTTLASAFLFSNDAGQKLEHIFVLSPRLFVFDEQETLKLEQQKAKEKK